MSKQRPTPTAKPNEFVRIVVSGGFAAGKSALARFIAKKLKDEGHTVTLDDEGPRDIPDNPTATGHFPRSIEVVTKLSIPSNKIGRKIKTPTKHQSKNNPNTFYWAQWDGETYVVATQTANGPILQAWEDTFTDEKEANTMARQLASGKLTATILSRP